MLQQTRVETVLDYYPRFLVRFPTLETLAEAPLEAVLKAWEGLGYYGRARNLHRAARGIRDRFDGRFPDDFEAVAALPGIGRSTAGAILSIAFGRPCPVLDGNVRRVLVRLSNVVVDPMRPVVLARLWSEAEAWCAGARDPGLHTQAMMELGATVCTPRAPRCTACPVAAGCSARRTGRPGDLPVRTPRPAIPRHDVAVALLRDRGRLLVQRRPEGRLLGGLWELPGGRIRRGETPAEGLLRVLREEHGIEARVDACVAVVRHAYTHFAVTLHAFPCRRVGGRLRPEAPVRRWVTPDELDRLAVPRGTRRVLEAVHRGGSPGTAGEGRRPATTGVGAGTRPRGRTPPSRRPRRRRSRAPAPGARP